MGRIRRILAIAALAVSGAAAYALEFVDVDEIVASNLGLDKIASLSGLTYWETDKTPVEIEYLESTGTQYIIVPDLYYDAVVDIKIDFQVLAKPTTWTDVCGAERVYDSRILFRIWRTTARFIAYVKTDYHITDFNFDRHTWEINFPAKAIYFDNVRKVSSFGLPTPDTRPLALFGSTTAQNGSTYVVTRRFTGRIFHVITKDSSGNVVHDLVPFRVGSKGCLYDKRGIGGMNPDGSPRNDGLYFNLGTGNFILGPDK